MRILTDPQHPDTRTAEYEAAATKLVKVLIREVYYNDGYRVADEGEDVKMTPMDCAILSRTNPPQVEEIPL